MSHALRAVLLTGLALALGAASASALGSDGTRLAYVDPGSGSFLLQALVATLAGVIVGVQAYWQRIKALLGLSVPKPGDEEGPSQTP